MGRSLRRYSCGILAVEVNERVRDEQQEDEGYEEV